MKTRKQSNGGGIALAFLALWTMLGGTGCARSVVSTEVMADGSWKRTVKLYANAPQKEAMMPVQTLDDTFVMPKGPGWTTSRKIEKKEGQEAGGENPFSPPSEMEVYTAERTMKLGEALAKDLAIKSTDKKATMAAVVNAIQVTQIAPGRYEYKETVRWQGPLPDEFQKTDTKTLEALKTALPAQLATPENVKDLEVRLNKAAWMMLFGPNEPFMASMLQMMMFPDSAERRIKRRVTLLLDGILTEKFGEKMSVEERRAVALKLADATFKDVKSRTDKKTNSGPPNPNAKPDTGSGMVSLTHTVKMPGRIVEANGEIDPISNEVVWTYFSEAAAAGEIVLRAVCDVKQ